MYNKLAKDVFYTFSTTIVNTAIGFVSSIIVAKLLGPEQQGIIKVILLLPAMLYTFMNFGIESAIMYFGSKEKNFKTAGKLSNRFALYFLLAAGFVGLTVIAVGSQFTDYYKDVPFAYLAAILLLAPLTFYQGTQTSLLRAENNFVRYNLVNTVKQVVYVVVVLFVFLYRSVWVVIIANYMMQITGILLSKIGVHHKNNGIDRPYLKDLVKYGFKTYVSNVINFFNYRFDQVLLTPTVTKAQLGIYSVAQTLSEMIWMIPNSVSTVLLPRIAAMHEDEKRAVALRVCRYVGTIMFFVVIFGYLATGFLLPLLYSQQYVDSIVPFRILLIGTFFMTYCKILGNTIAAYGKPEKNIAANIAGSLSNVLLNIILIPKYGIIGAAISGSISYSISGFATIIIFMRMNQGKARLPDILFMNKNDFSSLFRLVGRKLKAGK